MRKTAPLALLAGLVFVAGCDTLGGIKSFLGIKPSKVQYDFDGTQKEVWEAARDVLADMGYTFKEANRDEWFLESRWNSYGTDWSHENHRYRVTFELEDGGRKTIMWLVVEHESNSSTDPLEPGKADWSSEDPDEDQMNEIAYRVRKKLANDGDIYAKTLKRLEEEESRHPKKKVEYGEPK